MNKTKEKVLELYQDKKNYRPPTYQWIADQVGVTKALVGLYVRGIGK